MHVTKGGPPFSKQIPSLTLSFFSTPPRHFSQRIAKQCTCCFSSRRFILQVVPSSDFHIDRAKWSGVKHAHIHSICMMVQRDRRGYFRHRLPLSRKHSVGGRNPLTATNLLLLFLKNELNKGKKNNFFYVYFL